MEFSAGDYIAFAALVFGALAWGIREYRASETLKVADAKAATTLKTVVDSILAKIKEITDEIVTLNAKRETHEINCARINERTAASQERTAAILERVERDIEVLKAQMAHIASGGASKMREIG